MSLYLHEERAKSRAAYRHLTEIAAQIKENTERGTEIRPEADAVIKVLTESLDPNTRYRTVSNLADELRTRHLAKLRPLASEDFSAFCEYVDPDEPPESPWHIFLTGKLQEIESNPDLNRFILNCPPGHAKPLSVDTLVLMGDATWKRLGDIKVGDSVVSHTGATRTVTAVHEQGVLPVLKLTTKTGRTIITAADHSFKVKDAWKKAEDLRPGDRLDIVSKPSTKWPAKALHRAEYRLAALIAAHASVTWTKPRTARCKPIRNVHLWTSHRSIALQAIEALKVLDIKHKAHAVGAARSAFAIRFGVNEGVDLTKRFGIEDRAEDRRIPSWVFKAPDDLARLYIETFINSRAEVPTRYDGGWIILYAKSENYLRDFQRLLARFKVPSRVEPADVLGGRAYLALEAPHTAAFLKEGFGIAGPLGARLRASGEAARADIDEVVSVVPAGEAKCRCLTVEVDHTFSAEGVVVHNSTYASRRYVAWRLGRDPDQRIIGGGHSQRFVENEFSKKIRTLVRSQEYRDVFPGVVIDHATSASDQWALAGRKGQYVAKGVGQGIHGFRATFICVDDPYSKIEDAESANQRDKVNTWFITDIGSRLLPDGKVFVIMTRFHEDDLTGFLMKMNPDLPPESRWALTEAPAICYTDDASQDVINRRQGEVLWPKYDLGYFKTKKAEFRYSRFALMYQQLADASSTDSITGCFQYYTHLPHRSPEAIAEARKNNQVDASGRPRVDRKNYFRRVVLSVDTASKPTERADYTCIQVWGETHDRKHYLMDNKRIKVDFNRMIEAIESTAKHWDAEYILVEDKGQGTAYIQARGQTDYQQRSAPAPLIPIDPKGQSKEFRFDEICPMIEAGEVYLPEEPLWLNEFIKELGQFPEGAHDDQVDALSQYLRWAKSTRARYGSKRIGSMG